ncbi:MAG: tripartite tricarboxylate transporter TctB family protein [Mailhella sp.]|nr:tripartite tricarboxylate transporter TctB family protein [Mailhella sp.]
MLKSTADIGSGIGFLAIAAGFFFQMDMDGSGVSFVFPAMLIAIIAWGGLYYLVKGILERRIDCPGGECEGEHWGNIFWVAGMSVAHALAIPIAGYWISTCAFLAITYFVLVFRNGDPVKALIHSVLFGGGFSFLVWLGFVKLMSVPTPQGMLW